MTELIDEMNLQERIIGIPPPGCSVFAYYYFDVDMAESAHGRGAAVATGIKRAFPEAIVSLTRGMAILLPSVLQRLYTLPIEERK